MKDYALQQVNFKGVTKESSEVLCKFNVCAIALQPKFETQSNTIGARHVRLALVRAYRWV